MNLGNLLIIRLESEHDPGRITGHEVDEQEDEDGNPEANRDNEDHPAEDESEHNVSRAGLMR
jgi:hypothetical protein